MAAEENKTTATATVTPETEQPAASKEQEVLAQQQANDASDDEEFLSDGAEVVDANDASQLRENLDLDMSNVDEKIWLVRVPRFLAERWRNKENLHGQELGKIKIKKTSDKPNIKLSLTHDASSIDIPHEYDLQLTKNAVENQYIFTEKNLNKFEQPTDNKTELEFKRKREQLRGMHSNTPAPNNGNSAASSNGNGTTNNNSNNNNNSGNSSADMMNRRKRRFNKWKNRDGTDKTIPFVKTIPKKTALIGTVVHEAQVIPSITDPNYSKIIEARKRLVREEPRPTVTLLEENSGISLSNAGLTLKTDTSNFLKNSQPSKSKAEGRAIRMPQKDLFDLLFQLFDQFDYWSLKGLKERTKQPEVYLKETLEQIAVLIKKGPYALKYTLKKEYKELKDRERAERLGDLAKEDEEEDEDEENEDDVEMEDVV